MDIHKRTDPQFIAAMDVDSLELNVPPPAPVPTFTVTESQASANQTTHASDNKDITNDQMEVVVTTALKFSANDDILEDDMEVDIIEGGVEGLRNTASEVGVANPIVDEINEGGDIEVDDVDLISSSGMPTIEISNEIPNSQTFEKKNLSSHPKDIFIQPQSEPHEMDNTKIIDDNETKTLESQNSKKSNVANEDIVEAADNSEALDQAGEDKMETNDSMNIIENDKAKERDIITETVTEKVSESLKHVGNSSQPQLPSKSIEPNPSKGAEPLKLASSVDAFVLPAFVPSSPPQLSTNVQKAEVSAHADSVTPNSVNNIPEDHAPSIRFTRLTEAVARSLKLTIKSLTLRKLKSCYPVFASTPTGERYLQQALDQITTYLETGAMREFQQIFEEKNLSQLFISLDTIIQEAQDRKQRYTQKFQATQNPKIDSMDVDDGAEIENSIDVLDKPLMVAELTPDKIMASHLRAIQEREVIMLESALDNATNAYRDTLSRLNDSQIKIGLHAANLTKAFTALDELVHHSQTMLTRAEVNERIDQINFY